MKTIVNYQSSIILLLLITMACSNEANFQKKDVNYFDNGQIQKEKLQKDRIIDGYPCTAWVHFYKNGQLHQFELSKAFQIAGIQFPQNTIVFLNEQGELDQVYLSMNMSIQNYQCSGGNKKTATGFYPSGKLRFFFPHDNVMIGEILCKGGIMSGVWLYESGRLQKAYLAKEFKYKNKEYKKGDLIELEDQ